MNDEEILKANSKVTVFFPDTCSCAIDVTNMTYLRKCKLHTSSINTSDMYQHHNDSDPRRNPTVFTQLQKDNPGKTRNDEKERIENLP